jgi:hypothetical protein
MHACIAETGVQIGGVHLGAGLDAERDGAGHELIHKFVQACMAAQVL